jgi:hypothetical protein
MPQACSRRIFSVCLQSTKVNLGTTISIGREMTIEDDGALQ